jgi:hypothetical protein
MYVKFLKDINLPSPLVNTDRTLRLWNSEKEPDLFILW